MPRWLFNLIGHVLAALLGLAIGYCFFVVETGVVSLAVVKAST